VTSLFAHPHANTIADESVYATGPLLPIHYTTKPPKAAPAVKIRHPRLSASPTRRDSTLTTLTTKHRHHKSFLPINRVARVINSRRGTRDRLHPPQWQPHTQFSCKFTIYPLPNLIQELSLTAHTASCPSPLTSRKPSSVAPVRHLA
jgi:hypothetical protein